MAIKEFIYRGKSWDQLKDLSAEEFAKMVPSRSRRTILRNPLMKKFLKEVSKARKEKDAKALRTHYRDLIIVPEMVGLKIAVHKGNSFDEKFIEKEMVGHYLGEFALTRKKLMHGKAGIGATKSSTAIATKKT